MGRPFTYDECLDVVADPELVVRERRGAGGREIAPPARLMDALAAAEGEGVELVVGRAEVRS